MNERFRELAEQAGKYADDNFKGEPTYSEAYDSKFAELIVRECLNIMSKTSEEANTRFTYMGDDVPTVVHQMNIEKHFGVKE